MQSKRSNRIRSISARLLEPLLARGQFDLVAEYAVPLPVMVIAELLGAPAPDFAQFRHWSDVILGLSHSVEADERARAAEEDFRAVTDEMRAYLSEVLEHRRVAPRDDLFTRLREAEVDGARLTQDEILGFFQLLLVAGHETTTNLISNAVVCFAEHPGERARVRAEPALLPRAIEEVLRYRSPVQATFRRTRREVALHGQTIPRGKLVLRGRAPVAARGARRDARAARGRAAHERVDASRPVPCSRTGELAGARSRVTTCFGGLGRCRDASIARSSASSSAAGSCLAGSRGGRDLRIMLRLSVQHS